MSRPDTDSRNLVAAQVEPQIIAPVAFRPSDTQTTGRKLRPLHFVLALLAGIALGVFWFLFTARSVALDIYPADAQGVTLDVAATLKFVLGDVFLLRPGEYAVTVDAPGYYAETFAVAVGSDRNQRIDLNLRREPGRVNVITTPANTAVSVDGALLGNSPLTNVEIAAGSHEFHFHQDRYEPLSLQQEVVGKGESQTVTVELLPDWADVQMISQPSGAQVFIDDVNTGLMTPAAVPVPSGEHEIKLVMPGHRSYRQRLYIAARQAQTLPTISLERADSLLNITSTPAGAGITVNGKFQGETPLELSLKSGEKYRIRAFKAGYAAEQFVQTPKQGTTGSRNFALQRLTGKLSITAQPEAAVLYVDGKPRGAANQTLTLPSRPHQLEVRLDGYAGYKKTITPRSGVPQELRVKLLTVADAKLAALPPIAKTSLGQELVLVKPATEAFQMGASRREPGRRANETLRRVRLERLFYLGTREVTNAEFQAFASGHDTGDYQEQPLSKATQPVANLSWFDAAEYCNWLSKKDGLPPYYRLDLGKLKGVNVKATGYRLPNEAEWAFAARQFDSDDDGFRFPWGSRLPPPDRHGNYADRSAAHTVGRIIFGYNDNHITSAPVGTFAANKIGLFDMGGNVAEWMSDFYEIPESTDAVATDPMGPKSGEYHVIKGASWMHGTVTDLRLSYRDYGVDARQDVGLRLARYAEAE